MIFKFALKDPYTGMLVREQRAGGGRTIDTCNALAYRTVEEAAQAAEAGGYLIVRIPKDHRDDNALS